jgi:hypothetical protein
MTRTAELLSTGSWRKSVDLPGDHVMIGIMAITLTAHQRSD